MLFGDFFFRPRVFFAPDEGGGSGGGAAGGDAGKGAASGNAQAPTLESLMATVQALQAKLDAQGGAPKPDKGILDNARDDAADRDKAVKRDQALTAAVQFDLKKSEFLKTNESLLPKEVKDVFEKADKGVYQSPIEKDQDIKAGMIQSFFSQQANVDALTPGQKDVLDEYLKLTNAKKQEQAQSVYSMVFEPALAMIRGQKKAAILEKGGHISSDADEAYKKRMFELGQKRWNQERR